jgi:ArsR family transcriptional regulator
MNKLRKDPVGFKAKIFKALADPARLQIIEFLREGEKCVCEIVPHLKMAQPLVSRHLRILKDCGLVNDRKEGNRRLYSIVDRRVLGIINAVPMELINILSRQIIEKAT